MEWNSGGVHLEIKLYVEKLKDLSIFNLEKG